MQLNPGAFNAHLQNMGQKYEWRQSFACPCVNPTSGAARPGCLQCGAAGRLWLPPVAGVAGMAGSKVQHSWAQHGLYESGDIVVTIGSDQPLYAIRPFDRLVAKNNVDPFSIPLVRGAGDRLFGPVLSITRVFWLDDDQAIVEGGIPTVSSTGALTWPNGGAPPAGKSYSITGTRYAEFFCFNELPSNRQMHSGALLPRKVVLRRFDLYSRAGKT